MTVELSNVTLCDSRVVYFAHGIYCLIVNARLGGQGGFPHDT